MRKFRLDVVFLMETLVVNERLERIGRNVGFGTVFGDGRVNRGG